MVSALCSYDAVSLHARTFKIFRDQSNDVYARNSAPDYLPGVVAGVSGTLLVGQMVCPTSWDSNGQPECSRSCEKFHFVRVFDIFVTRNERDAVVSRFGSLHPLFALEKIHSCRTSSLSARFSLRRASFLSFCSYLPNYELPFTVIRVSFRPPKDRDVTLYPALHA